MKAVPFARLFVALATGIGAALFYANRFGYIGHYPYISAALLLIAGLLFFLGKQREKLVAGVILMLSIFFMGFSLGHYGQIPNHQSFFWSDPNFEKAAYVKVVVDDPIREKSNSWRTSATIESYWFTSDSGIETSGKTLLYWPKRRNRSRPDFRPGQELIIKNTLMIMPRDAFPEDFNYRAVMRYQNIQHQVFLDSTAYVVLGKQAKGFMEYSKDCKLYLLSIFEQNFSPKLAGLAESIVLGHKDNLEKDDSDSFAKSGTMHILAVSGLHVGMIYLILLYLFTLGNKGKKLKRWQSILLLLILWVYAFVTGLGASVIRASLMFTLIELGRSFFGRHGGGFNGVFAAAFIQLLIFPLNLIEVGFQLSYLAVLGILFFYPKIYSMVAMPNVLLSKAWQLACVSLSATLGTLPVTMYFFHTFPVWFMFSNILLVPFGMLLLVTLIAVLLLSWVPFVGTGIVFMATWGLKILLVMVHFFAALPFAQITDIQISELEVFLLLLFIPTIFYWLYHRNINGLHFWTIVALMYSGYFWYGSAQSHKQRLIVTSELRNQFLVCVVQGNHMINISQPMRRSLSDSLFEFQSRFIHSHNIKKMDWVYYAAGDSMINKNLSIKHFDKQYSIVNLDGLSPLVIHWKARKGQNLIPHFNHVIQNRYMKYADTTVQYAVLKNSYHIFK
jgi:competence protein ComEC